MASPAPPACRQDGHHEPDRVIAIAWNGCSTLAGSAVRHRRNAHCIVCPAEGFPARGTPCEPRPGPAKGATAARPSLSSRVSATADETSHLILLYAAVPLLIRPNAPPAGLGKGFQRGPSRSQSHRSPGVSSRFPSSMDCATTAALRCEAGAPPQSRTGASAGKTTMP